MNPFARGVLENPIGAITGGGLGALGSIIGNLAETPVGSAAPRDARFLDGQSDPSDAFWSSVSFPGNVAGAPLRYRASPYYDGPGIHHRPVRRGGFGAPRSAVQQ